MSGREGDALDNRRGWVALAGGHPSGSRRLLPALWLLLAAPPAAAHLLPAQQGTINVVGDSAFVALSLPVRALHGVDDDGDGRLGADELRRHQAGLRDEIGRRLVVDDGERAGERLALDFVLSPEHDGRGDRAEQLVALLHVRFAAPPRQLELACDLFDGRPLTVTATRRRDGHIETEAAVLAPGTPRHRFFRPLVFAWLGYVRVGAAHILGGLDHLLFLATILVAGLGWRAWLRVVTAFTLAHSLTLAAALLGWVRVAPRVVEPLIAASIVLMALDHLLRRPHPRQRVALVGACGLLHGLGFAASLDAMGLDRAHRLASLVGFNLGVELGQGLFIVAALALLALLARLGPAWQPARLGRLVTLFAAVVGAWWMVERLAGA